MDSEIGLPSLISIWLTPAKKKRSRKFLILRKIAQQRHSPHRNFKTPVKKQDQQQRLRRRRQVHRHQEYQDQQHVNSSGKKNKRSGKKRPNLGRIPTINQLTKGATQRKKKKKKHEKSRRSGTKYCSRSEARISRNGSRPWISTLQTRTHASICRVYIYK